MKYYIGHIHRYGDVVDSLYVEDLAREKKILEEKSSIEEVDQRIKELQEEYPENNLLHFVY